MSRWEPNGRERLERAALALFTERGYEDSTVAEIADRAGLTRSTFFRHFADKREVLFGGRDELADLFAETIRSAPPETSTLGCLAAALGSIAPAFSADRHELAGQRRAVIAANADLRERELLKRARLADALSGALRARGLPETDAMLAAQIGLLAFSSAYATWAAPDNARPYPQIADEALRDLADRVAALVL
jgi:AcrR family transcriptional regulator